MSKGRKYGKFLGMRQCSPEPMLPRIVFFDESLSVFIFIFNFICSILAYGAIIGLIFGILSLSEGDEFPVSEIIIFIKMFFILSLIVTPSAFLIDRIQIAYRLSKTGELLPKKYFAVGIDFYWLNQLKFFPSLAVILLVCFAIMVIAIGDIRISAALSVVSVIALTLTAIINIVCFRIGE